MQTVCEKYKLSRYNVLCNHCENEYMWNTYSDALLKLDSSGQEYLRTFTGLDDNSDEFKLLKDNGFIVYEAIDEFGRICMQEKQSLFNKNSSRMMFVVTPTMECNYRCGYCFESNTERTNFMTPEIADEVANYICYQLKTNSCVKKFHIIWFGGEPLLRSDIIEIISRKVMLYAKENDVSYSASIATNGRLLDNKTLQLLHGLHVNKAQITVDGMRDLYCKSKIANYEDFDCVIDNICNAADMLKISIRLNIPSNNADEAIKITDYILTERGLKDKIHLYLAYLCDYTAKPDESEKAYRGYVESYLKWSHYVLSRYGAKKIGISYPKRKNSSCAQVKSINACIGTQGEMYKCEHNFGNSTMVIGDIWQGRFFNNAELAYYDTNISVPFNGRCIECNFVPVCMGGCKNDHVNRFVRMDCAAFKRLQAILKLHEGGICI